MSNHAPASSPTPPTAPHAIDVGFSSIRQRHGESSSRAESRSLGKRSSSSSQKREREARPATPPNEESPREELSKSTGSIKQRQRTRSSGGFLLDSPFANGSPRVPDRHGKRKMQDAPLRVDKRRGAPNRLSNESSLRSSPLSREVSMGEDGTADARDGKATSRPPSMDAAQLVQMALNLSETRKRHVSNTLRVPSGSERRVISMPISNVGTVRAVSGARQRSSHLSERPSQDFPDSSKDMDGDVDDSDSPILGIGDLDDQIFYTFTPATLARAEKARKYFELASEYRRLLQSLPALKPDVSPSSGRAYNPIQSLRNRRVRIREKRPFPALPETWVDPEIVDSWITDVESNIKYSDYDTSDESITLPRFEGEFEAAPVRPESRQLHSGARHKRTDTVGSVITRPENSWTIEPTELLADAYWTEKGDNKAFIETRRGEPIFPDLQRPRVGTPKISIDIHREKSEEPQHLANGTDQEDLGRPSRRRKLMLPLSTSTDHRRHRLLRRASFSSDESSHDRHVSVGLLNTGRVENIGPLERHMQELIAKDERGELSSPEMTSPDRWNPRFQPPAVQQASIDRLRRDSSASRKNGRASLEVPRDLHRRSQSADGRVGSIDREIDEIGSDPGSPVFERAMPSMGMDLSSPSGTRHSLDESRSRGSVLPSFHSLHRDMNKVGQADFAEGQGNILSPILSANSFHQSGSSTPQDLKRQGTTDSWVPLRRLDTVSTMNSSKEGSTVGRFLRNRRGRKVKPRDRLDGGETSAGVTDVSEAEDNAVPNGPVKRNTLDEDSDASPRVSSDRAKPKPKFHLGNLPSFTSSMRDKRNQVETPNSAKDDPFANPTRRPRRFERPLATLTQGEKSNVDVTSETDNNSVRTRKGYGQLQPLFAEVAWHPTAPGGFTPGISQAKRHWSIYDNHQPTRNDKITARDIARVRALLLSSGIKAREIQRRADQPRDSPSSLLTKAASTTHSTPKTVAYKDEDLTAARLLSTHLSTSLAHFESTVSNFQSATLRTLGSRLEDLRQRASDQLSKLVHDTSDEADAFTMELNTKTPQQTKRVDDAVDEMLRRRRRQFRLFRVVGFKLLEWLVLAILWWIWFLVVVFNTGKKIVVGGFRVVHWLFTF